MCQMSLSTLISMCGFLHRTHLNWWVTSQEHWQQIMSNNYKYCLSNSGVQTSESTLKMWDFVLLKHENDCGKWKLLLCYDVKLMRNICRSSKLVTESICTDSQILASISKHKMLFIGDALSCWRTWSSGWTQKFKRSLKTFWNVFTF